MEINRKYVQDLLTGLSERTIAFPPVYARITGKMTAGVALAQLVYWWSSKGGQWLYKTDAEVCAETALTPDEWASAKKLLKASGFVSIELRGLPAKSHYFVHIDKITDAIVELQVSGNSRNKFVEAKSSGQDSGNSGTQFREITETCSGDSPKHTYIVEITNKNTTEITDTAPDFVGVTDEPDCKYACNAHNKSANREAKLRTLGFNPKMIAAAERVPNTVAQRGYIDITKTELETLLAKKPYSSVTKTISPTGEDIVTVVFDLGDRKQQETYRIVSCTPTLQAEITGADVPKSRKAKVANEPGLPNHRYLTPAERWPAENVGIAGGLEAKTSAQVFADWFMATHRAKYPTITREGAEQLFHKMQEYAINSGVSRIKASKGYVWEATVTNRWLATAKDVAQYSIQAAPVQQKINVEQTIAFAPDAIKAKIAAITKEMQK